MVWGFHYAKRALHTETNVESRTSQSKSEISVNLSDSGDCWDRCRAGGDNSKRFEDFRTENFSSKGQNLAVAEFFQVRWIAEFSGGLICSRTNALNAEDCLEMNVKGTCLVKNNSKGK
jgi:hypothetical protein